MKHLLNLEKYPLDNPESESYRALIERCKADIENDGMFTLPDFIWPTVAQEAAVAPIAETEASLHSREHNVYFKDSVEGLAADHPALRKVCGVNTLHRVVPIVGDRSRVVSIFSFFDRPDVVFSPKDQVRFYGRATKQSHE